MRVKGESFLRSLNEVLLGCGFLILRIRYNIYASGNKTVVGTKGRVSMQTRGS